MNTFKTNTFTLSLRIHLPDGQSSFIRSLLVFLLLLLFFSGFSQKINVSNLTCEHKVNPIGMDVLHPRFSWMITGKERNINQSAYAIRVATDEKFSSSGMVWQTGKITSDQSVFIEYDGLPLQPCKRYFWQVKIWDNAGNDTKWSEAAFWETGLLSPAGWEAKWIELPGDTLRYSPSPYFRNEFRVEKPVLSARAYVTSHGFYKLSLNGKKVGDQVLTPGWTSYSKRLQYQVYDITDMLEQGDNAIGAVLGNGWYKGTLGWTDKWAIYGKKTGLLMQIKVTYKDGTTSLIITDESWKACNDGPIRMNDIYNGETYDANKVLTGWDRKNYNDRNWKHVTIGNYKNDILIASEGAEIRRIQKIRPVKILRTPGGSLVVDMGQNMVGWVRLRVNGSKGTEVILRHAEILDKHGEFYTENLRDAKCQLSYTLAGTGEEVYEPDFTFMGFRYVEVSGFPGNLSLDDITGIVVHSDMQVNGRFECSNPLINQLQHNILWGQKGNFVDVPTDCPQRNERLGWTGDAQVFCRTAAFNMNVSSFFTKWLKDVSADQTPEGAVPWVIPDALTHGESKSVIPSAGWGDAAVIVPWTMYQVYGDKKFLEVQYSSMKAWVEYIGKKAGDTYLWKGGSVFGDWLFYHPPVKNHPEPDGYTDHDFIATAFFAHSAKILSLAANELGNSDDSKNYNQLFEKIRDRFIYEYVTPAGRVGTNSQTSYVLALMFDLLPEELRQEAADFLVENIKSRKYHLSTGFLGTPYLCHVLTRFGHTDIAYELLLQETYPSWLYPVKMGATTIWERWDGQKPDSTFQNPGMNSFNHYAYGAIGDWMYRICAGIEIGSAGYKNIVIHPHLTKKLNYAKASFQSPYGQIESGWERREGKVKVGVKIPANTQATIVLPARDVSEIKESGRELLKEQIVSNIRKEGNEIKFEIGSGEYIFEFFEGSHYIDNATVKKWSAPFRGWHYHPDHVIPAKANIQGFEEVYMTDVATVFQLPDDGKWYMTFIGFDGKGYQSFVAESDDLVHWTNYRLAMGYGEKGKFDHGGRVLGAFLYEDYGIKSSRTLKKKNGKYWSLYGAYPEQGGYELEPGSNGVAYSEEGLTWQQARDEPILSIFQEDCGAWEDKCIYQPWLLEYNNKYYNLYNAKGKGPWIEQMGLATSEDLINWKRYKGSPVIPVGEEGSYNEKFSADGKIFWDGDHWSCFFFGVGRGGAHVMMAFSYDLIHWTVDPDPLYKAGENPSGLDQKYAHKISLVWNPANETYYMFYNAVGNKGRGIGLITSKPLVK